MSQIAKLSKRASQVVTQRPKQESIEEVEVGISEKLLFGSKAHHSLMLHIHLQEIAQLDLHAVVSTNRPVLADTDFETLHCHARPKLDVS